ncbi:MAG: hypothetical protein ACRDIU_04620 [Actinomycetota bacterium]
MKLRPLIGGMLLATVWAGTAYADPADYYVENYSDPEAQGWYEFSKSNSGANSPDESQNASTYRSMQGPVTIDDADSNDSSEVSGNTLPVVGNDILGDVSAANGLLSGGGANTQSETSSGNINQTRSQDNDATHSANIVDSFNTGERIRVASEPKASPPGKSLPSTGMDYSAPLAMALLLVSAGMWMVRRGGQRLRLATIAD